MNKRKIAIFQDNLGLGGIQRSLINLLTTIDLKKYEIDLYLFSRADFYAASLPKTINVIYYKPQSFLKRFVPFSLYYLFKNSPVKKRYDVVIDFNGYQNITATYALKTKAKRYVYWIHNDAHALRNTRILRALYFRLLLNRAKWRRFDVFAGVSDGVLEIFKQNFPNKRTAVVPNLIDAESIIKKSTEKIDFFVPKDNFNLVTVGRLVYQKGIDLFLDDMAKIVKLRPKTHLYIIGDGLKRRELEQQVEELGLSKKVTFLGAQKNPYKYMSKMDGLVLNSHYEGQGMVLMEAKVLGLQLFFPKRLEKYNEGLEGMEDLVVAIVDAKKKPKKLDDLKKYNAKIIKRLEKIIDEKD